MRAAELNGLLQAGHRRAAREERALAAVIQEVLDEAVEEAVRRFETHAPVSLAAAAPTSLSAMVAVYPDPAEQAALALPDGEPVSELHCTLAFLGEIDDETLRRVEAAMRQVAATHAPREGWVGGFGYFAPAPDSDGLWPVLALPDVPGLPELRHAVTRALEDVGVPFAQNHGWLPHITLAYADSADAAVAAIPGELAGQPLTFRFLTVARGDVPVHLGLTRAPVVGGACPHGDPTCPCQDGDSCHYEGEDAWESPLMAAGERKPRPPMPDWRPPSGGELVDVDWLAARLRERTEHTRRALIESVMRAHLDRVAVEWDTTNPLVAKAFASTGRHIVAVAHATRVRVNHAVQAAYREGLSIPNAAIAIRSQMLEASALRARTIARTELVTAVNSASLQAVHIVAAAAETTYMKVWLTAPGADHPRHEEYDDLDGQTVPLDGWFNVGGYDLEYPGDQGGPPEEVINCFPGGTLVVAPDAEMGFRRRYDGPLVRVYTDAHHVLAATPNHPVLTGSGWKPLGLVREGDHLVGAAPREDEARVHPDVHDAPAAIQEVFGALARDGLASRVRGGAVQFHGDAVGGEVEVVASHRMLRDRLEAALPEEPLELPLVRAREVAGAASALGSSREVVLASTLPADRRVRGRRLPGSFLRGRPAHPLPVRRADPAPLDPELQEPPLDDAAADAVELAKGLLGDALEVSVAQVVRVELDSFHGDVFNLQTRSGCYLAGSLVVHNCRCTMEYTEGPASEAE